MAEDQERPAPTIQHEEDANEATVERNELLRGDTDGQEEQGEAASDHSRHRDETSRLHEERSDRLTRSCSTEIQASQQLFRCWHGGIESSEVEEFIYGGFSCQKTQISGPGPPRLTPSVLHHSVIKGQPPPPGHLGNLYNLATTLALEIRACFLRATATLSRPIMCKRIFVVPLKEMNPSKFLREARAVSSFRTSITRINGNDDLTHTYGKQRSDTLKDIVSKEIQAGMVDVSQDGTATVGSKPQAEPSPAVNHGPASEKTSRTMDHIEFTARRNLEHILGVCAIPVAVHVSGENAEGLTWKKLRDVQPIALTCGDLSGHRISTAASFFAFQFLAEIAKRLSRCSQPNRDDTHVQTLLCRIEDVCLGHLKWLCAAEKTEKDEVFGSLCWVSGEAVILPEKSQSWVPRKHVRNTAFQILKATIFAESFRGDNVDSSLIGEMISQWGRGWVRWLERSDRRESLTWDHKEDQGLKVFRLDDHIWIWRALKAMEDKRLGVWAILCGRAQRDDKGSSTDHDAPDVAEILRCRRKLASQAVQQEVLRNFTAEHEILRKRMVALTRSPRDTRFLLHARDTALLYSQDMGFFTEDTSILEAWKNTIDVQRFHETNQDVHWDNALRYALAIMLGIRGHQINNKQPGHMVRAATEVLLRSSSENGLTYPHQIRITPDLDHRRHAHL